MSARTLARILAVAWLTVVWCAAMESVRVGTIVAGALVASALVLAFPTRDATLRGSRLGPVALVRMNAFLFGQLLRANLQVAWAVISPRRAGVRPGIVAVALVPSSDLVLALLLNAVSLTPGTLILEVRRDPLVLYIHVLQFRTRAQVHLDVLGMQRRIVAALGPRSALAAIDERLATLREAVRAGATEPDPDPSEEAR